MNCVFIIESDPCIPNPCHKGTCLMEEDDFSCVCDGTGYGGPTCNQAIINLEPILDISDPTSIPVTLSTTADLQTVVRFRVKLSGPSHVIQMNVYLRNNTSSFTLPGVTGILTVSVIDESKNILYMPKQRTVFVSGNARNQNSSFFTKFNLQRGQLMPSCCTPDDTLSITCPGTAQNIVLKSACEWEKPSKNVHRSVGVVFAEGNKLSLPTSIAGLRYRLKRHDDIIVSTRSCTPCYAVEPFHKQENPECYCYNFTILDTQDFLKSRALAFTYLKEIQRLLPSWLHIAVNLTFSQSRHMSKFNSFAPITRSQDVVSSVEGCQKLNNLMNSIYSVLRHDKTISATIDGIQYDYRENSDTGNTDDPMCFAVSLCQGEDSPVHMQISQPVHSILVSEYLQQFTSRQWSINLNTVSVFKSGTTTTIQQKFWNGVRMITPPDIEADVSINGEIGADFKDEHLILKLDFTGKSTFDYKVSNLPISINYLHDSMAIFSHSLNMN